MKRILVALLSVLCLFTLISCTEISSVEENKSMFVLIEQTSIWKIVYHKETKVMYAVSYGSKSYGEFTLLVDENGKPLLWEGGN